MSNEFQRLEDKIDVLTTQLMGMSEKLAVLGSRFEDFMELKGRVAELEKFRWHMGGALALIAVASEAVLHVFIHH